MQLVILFFFEVLVSLRLIVMMCSGHIMSGTMVRMILLQSAHLDPIQLKVKVMHICTFALSPNQPIPLSQPQKTTHLFPFWKWNLKLTTKPQNYENLPQFSGQKTFY